ncbi:DUF4214 domain-containing protein [Halomonas sp. SpR1]|uniref:DUF4214 domain-containing protein n=1 Tax=Halomonas sp. SpR1 TaxID=3050462 RepID=UPI0027E3BDE4|nr:DUF4214 domain-containing protein [Halomonas sp. SpR1]MDQ7733690.1 DUF4214 domain-containing protein [Halomonas sp. SpR1]
MALSDTQIQQLYTAYLGRPADQAGINYWKEQDVSEAQLRDSLANDAQPEYVELYGDRTRAELVEAVYQNMFGREADADGLEYWVNGDGASVPASQLQQLFIAAASDEDRAAFDAQVEEDLGNVDPLPPEPGTDETVRLTQQADNLQGADGSDTTFEAPVTQNETGSGALANTFETGDVLDGGADSTNVLRADLIASGAISDNWAPAISAETTNIQEVYLRGQTTRVDNGASNTTFGASNTTFGATVDAEKMAGVEQWWTDNSRADIRIEDIRTATDETTFGMRETDPEVGYEAYFNPLFLEGDVSSDSELSIVIQEIDGDQVLAANELQNITVREVNFTVGGEDVTLANDQISAANTWAELEAAIAAEIEAQSLEGLSVSHTGNGQFVIDDEQGRPFEIVEGEALIFGATADIDVRNRVEVGRLEQEGPTQTTLVLDGAGNGSRGGDVNIAAMSGDRGIEVMDVLVDRDSHIKSLRSENNPNSVQDSFSAEQQLEEVNLTHVAEGAQGTFQVGARTVDEKGVSTTIDDRLSVDVDEDGQGDSGLRDVRVFNATGYSAEIKLAAELSIDVFDKYLAGADETVQFSYLLGDAGNNLSLTVDNEVASDPDFALEIVGGDSSDRVNLTDLAVKNSTTIDLEGGEENTVEVSTTTGATADEDGNFTTAAGQVEYSTAQTAFGEFVNVDRLVVADDNNTRQNIVSGNMTAIDGKEIVIATDAQLDANGDLVPGSAADTDIVEARIDTDLTITGKNQTLGSLNNNNDQFIGVVDVINTRPVPSQSNLEVQLDNTARLDGELTVAALNVSTEAGGTSAVRELDLTSGGRRNTENLVQSAALAGVNAVDLDGTQNLDLHIASMASGASVVDGSDLGGDLDLAINGGLLTGATDVLTGTAAATDTLAVYGGDAQATVTGFETIQLGLAANNQFNGAFTGFAGEFNAAAVSGVEQYSIAALSGAAELINLSGSEVVNVAANGADANLTLIAGDRDGSNEITVNFAGDYTSELSVQDYRTVTLGLAADTDYDFALDLETADGTNAGTTYARTLEIVGGGVDANGDVTTTLNIGDLDTALSTVDLSGFEGNLLNAQWAEVTGTNGTVVANEYNFSFNVGGDGTTSEFISSFDFNADADEAGVVWQIDNFQVFGQGGVDLTNQSIIDLRDLGVDSAADIVVADANDFFTALDGDAQQAYIDQGYAAADFAAGDTVVTSNEGLDFTILLNGVTSTDLVNENFAGIA